MPLLLLIVAALLNLVFIGLEVYLWREWYLYKELDEAYARQCLAAALVLTAYLLFIGRMLTARLLGKQRKGEDEPDFERSSEREELMRPDGTLINIEFYGEKDKPAIIFLHGWNSNSLQWYYQKKYFAKDYRLIFVDLAGLGRTSRPANNDYSLEKLAADLQAVIEKTSPKDPVLWGHSMGGMTVLTFCKMYSEQLSKIKGIILQHTTYTNPTKKILYDRLFTAIQELLIKPLCRLIILLSPLLQAIRAFSYLNGTMFMMVRIMVFAGTQSRKQLEFASRVAATAAPAVTARGVLAMLKYDASDVLPCIPVPVLIIAGDGDKLTKAEASRTMHKSIPGSQLVTVSPGGHLSMIERHGEVNKAANSFLKVLQTAST